MAVTKVVRFSDHEVSTSDIDPEQDEGFVTKRTFELLEHDEPFLEKQFKIFQQTASEHCEAWKENLKEVVGPVFDVMEPIKQNANRCVDCMMESIQRAQLQGFVLGTQKPMTMVGGPAPDMVQKKAASDAKALLSTIEVPEKTMQWVATGTYQNCPRKPTIGIMKKSSIVAPPMMVQQILRDDTRSPATESLESSDQGSVSSRSFKPETQAFLQKHKSLTEEEEPYVPSGQRPESPIKLFSSQDIEEILFQTDTQIETLPGNDPENPIILEDFVSEDFEDDAVFDNVASHERTIDTSDREERDQPPPDSPILQDFTKLPPTADGRSLDFRPIENFSNHSHVPLSRSLLFSMRSRNRDIENLLAELPTKYNFSASGDDASTDHLAAASSIDSKRSGHISQENSIDSTRDFESNMASDNTVQSTASHKKNFKLISFRSAGDTMSVTSAPPSTQMEGRPLVFPLLPVDQSNE